MLKIKFCFLFEPQRPKPFTFHPNTPLYSMYIDSFTRFTVEFSSIILTIVVSAVLTWEVIFVVNRDDYSGCVNIHVHCSCKKRFQPFCVSVMWCHWNYLYSRRSLIGLQTCQLSRCSRESPSFSSNLSVSRLEHQISLRELSEGLRVIFGEYSGIVKNDILNVPAGNICMCRHKEV